MIPPKTLKIQIQDVWENDIDWAIEQDHAEPEQMELIEEEI